MHDVFLFPHKLMGRVVSFTPFVMQLAYMRGCLRVNALGAKQAHEGHIYIMCCFLKAPANDLASIHFSAITTIQVYSGVKYEGDLCKKKKSS